MRRIMVVAMLVLTGCGARSALPAANAELCANAEPGHCWSFAPELIVGSPAAPANTCDGAEPGRCWSFEPELIDGRPLDNRIAQDLVQ